MCNNPNLELVNINAYYAKVGQNSPIRTQDIERKQNSDVNQGQKLCYKFAKIDKQHSQPWSYQC